MDDSRKKRDALANRLFKIIEDANLPENEFKEACGTLDGLMDMADRRAAKLCRALRAGVDDPDVALEALDSDHRLWGTT